MLNAFHFSFRTDNPNYKACLKTLHPSKWSEHQPRASSDTNVNCFHVSVSFTTMFLNIRSRSSWSLGLTYAHLSKADMPFLAQNHRTEGR